MIRIEIEFYSRDLNENGVLGKKHGKKLTLGSVAGISPSAQFISAGKI